MASIISTPNLFSPLHHATYLRTELRFMTYTIKGNKETIHMFKCHKLCNHNTRYQPLATQSFANNHTFILLPPTCVATQFKFQFYV